MISLADLLTATGGSVYGPVHCQEFSDFCYDTRLLRPGELFLAVITDKGDGHDYVLDAARLGAGGVLCQHPMDLAPWPVTCIVVDDSRQALVDWARHTLRRLAPLVVGITGSSGKTTTKELATAVLARRFAVFRNQGNYNDRYGLPIALGRLGPEHKVAVLELACNSPDEIRELAALTRPRIGIVTNVTDTHLPALGPPDASSVEQGRLVEVLPPAAEGGVAVLNYDDPRVRAMAGRTRAQVVTYGLSADADLVAGAVETGPDGTSFTVFVKEFFPLQAPRGSRKLRVHIALLGKHSVYAALAAIASGLALGVPLDEALAAMADIQPLPGRLRPLPGVQGTLILDDSLDASPATTLAALDTLALFKKGRRVAVLGTIGAMSPLKARADDRSESGSDSGADNAFRQVGRQVAEVAHLIVTQGDGAQRIAEEALAHGLAADQVRRTYTAEDTLRSLAGQLRPGDTILVKGATESRLEHVVAGLLAEPERATELLVRQTAGWQKVRLLRPGRPTFVEVDLEAIAHNTRRIVAIVGPNSSLLAVLKADAYGHGAVRVARTVLNNGARYLGVASLNEAMVLRQAGISAPILILGYTPAWQARDLARAGLAATVFDLDVARALSRAAGELQRPVSVHVKVDTGMGRLGLLPGTMVPFVQELHNLPHLVVEGIFTHFSVADGDPDYTRGQLDRFRDELGALVEAGLRPPLAHAANSAAILTLPESHLDMVRAGIALYGLDPSPQVRCPPDFQPAMKFKTQVAQVKTLPAGSYIGYGNTYHATTEQRIAVLPVGYADGFRRAPRQWGTVLVRGQRAPIVGRVSMDQTTIDVSHIPGVRQGDEVVLIGEQGGDRITAEDAADELGTINYEVISAILARVPRVV